MKLAFLFTAFALFTIGSLSAQTVHSDLGDSPFITRTEAFVLPLTCPMVYPDTFFALTGKTNREMGQWFYSGPPPKVKSYPLFKPLRYRWYGAPRSPFFRAATPTDSVFQGFRLTGADVLYTLPGSALFTGIGVSYEHDTYKTATGAVYCNWAIAFEGYEGGQFAPNSLQAVTALGINVKFFNKVLVIGLLYNLTTSKFVGGVGPNIPSIPGLTNN